MSHSGTASMPSAPTAAVAVLLGVVVVDVIVVIVDIVVAAAAAAASVPSRIPLCPAPWDYVPRNTASDSCQSPL